MSIKYTTQDRQLICSFQKDIVASAISELRDSLNTRLDASQEWRELVLDMQLVEKIDSLGINLIVWLFRLVGSSDKDFKIIGCDKRLMKLFTLFRLQDQFTIEAKE